MRKFLPCSLLLILLLPSLLAAGEGSAPWRSDAAPGKTSFRTAMLADTSADSAEAWSPWRGLRTVPHRLYRDVPSALKIVGRDLYWFYTAPVRIDGRSALWLGGLAAGGGLIMLHDQEVRSALDRNRNEAGLKWFYDMGDALEPMGLQAVTNKYYAAMFVVGYALDIKPLVHISVDLFESFLINAIPKDLTNRVVGRKRPFESPDDPYDFSLLGGTSFFSGHAATSMHVATVFSHHINWTPFTIAAHTAAVAVWAERIHSNSHWPSDVYVGAIYGYVISRELLRRRQWQRSVNPDPRGLSLQPAVLRDGAAVTLTWRF